MLRRGRLLVQDRDREQDQDQDQVQAGEGVRIKVGIMAMISRLVGRLLMVAAGDKEGRAAVGGGGRGREAEAGKEMGM